MKTLSKISLYLIGLTLITSSTIAFGQYPSVTGKIQNQAATSFPAAPNILDNENAKLHFQTVRSNGSAFFSYTPNQDNASAQVLYSPYLGVLPACFYHADYVHPCNTKLKKISGCLLNFISQDGSTQLLVTGVGWAQCSLAQVKANNYTIRITRLLWGDGEE